MFKYSIKYYILINCKKLITIQKCEVITQFILKYAIKNRLRLNIFVTYISFSDSISCNFV